MREESNGNVITLYLKNTLQFWVIGNDMILADCAEIKKSEFEQTKTLRGGHSMIKNKILLFPNTPVGSTSRFDVFWTSIVSDQVKSEIESICSQYCNSEETRNELRTEMFDNTVNFTRLIITRVEEIRKCTYNKTLVLLFDIDATIAGIPFGGTHRVIRPGFLSLLGFLKGNFPIEFGILTSSGRITDGQSAEIIERNGTWCLEVM
jgi:hypothetical protein